MNNIIIHTGIEQKTPQWFALKVRKLSSSQIDKISKTGKGSETETKLLYKLAGEGICGQMQESASSKTMDWGNKYEPEARDLYEIYSGNKVTTVTFVEPSKESVLYGYVGVSPDGLIFSPDNELIGGIEIKCPHSIEEHTRTLHTRKVPSQYVSQVNMLMYICDLEWVDFVSYHPLFTGTGNEIVIIRVLRDESEMRKTATLISGVVEKVKIIETEIRNKKS